MVSKEDDGIYVWKHALSKLIFEESNPDNNEKL